MTEPWQDRMLMHDLYVKKRMNITDIQKIFEKKYGKKTSIQTIYNYLKKFDLLKYRGKGRRIKIHQHMTDQYVSPQQQKIAQIRKRNKAIIQKRSKKM